MQMLYNSDSYIVVQFDVADSVASGSPAPGGASRAEPPAGGGYEIVDKFARKGIFLQGAMAESFKAGVESLAQGQPSEEEIDDYIERFASLMQQPVILH